MEPQACLSLAIQALHERREWLSRILNNPKTNAWVKTNYPQFIKECEEAITYLEGMKTLNQFVGGFKDCDFTLEVKERE